MPARWLFLGTGRITNRMFQALSASQSSELAAIASRSLSTAQRWIADHHAPHVEAIESYGRGMRRDDIDWVYIATPPATHFELAIAALQKGKHVLCEKPLCCSATEVEQLRKASVKSQRKILDATSFPYHPRTEAMKKLIGEGAIGEPRSMTIACSFNDLQNRDDDHRLQSTLGGGCLLDIGWYCAFASIYFGWRPSSIMASGRSFGSSNDIGGWKQAHALAVCENHLWAHWECSFETTGRRWLEIAGSDGTIVCDDFLRPKDLAKPRFWLHDSAGNASVQCIGTDVLQESLMVDFAVACDHDEALRKLQMAQDTQQLLDRWHVAFQGS